MPVPIIELQRRLTIVGAIRAGGEKPAKGVGKKLSSFRLTSDKRPLIEQAAKLYGGEVSSWRSPVGDEWQVYTSAPELPVLVMPGYSLRQTYELWEGATKRTRLCDGLEEELSGGRCICELEGDERCDLYTRLVVALPELDTVLGWRLITRGANAAHELPTIFALIASRVPAGQTFVPARLRIDERRGVKDGQVVRFVVPVLDLGIGYLAWASHEEARSLPRAHGSDQEAPGYEALPAQSFALSTALGGFSEPLSESSPRARKLAELGPQAETPTPGTRADPTGRPATLSTVPPGEPEIVPSSTRAELELELEPPPLARLINEPQEVEPERPPPQQSDEPQTRWPTGPQKKKLNLLVGRLRDDGHIMTRDLYRAIAKLRDLDPNLLVEQIGGLYQTTGEQEPRLHWSMLRENLTRAEAVQLIDWLETKQRRVLEAPS